MTFFKYSTSSCLFLFEALLAVWVLLMNANAFAQGTSGSLNEKIVGAYASWNYDVLPYDRIEYSNLTDIIVSPGTLNQDGSISYQRLPQLVADANAAGVKVLISLYTPATEFSSIAADSALRATLVSNAVTFLETTHYDGVEIDWEFPSTSAESQNLDSLIADMRAEFDKVDSSWLITMDLPGRSVLGKYYDIAYLINYVDWFNVMCYGLVGYGNKYAGFDSPLYTDPNDPNNIGSDSAAIAYWLSRGTYYQNQQLVHVDIPKSKLVLGVPFYGTKFYAPGLYQPLTNSTVTYPGYSSIIGYLDSGWAYHWYNSVEEPYLTNSSNTEFITYEDTNSVRYKARFAVEKGLGGIMVYELSQDVLPNGRQPLLETIAATMRGLTPVIQRPAAAGTFVLYDNYPNPFNPSTIIRYQLPIISHMTLKVYDVLGRLVKTLVNGNETAGRHEVTFEAGRLPSGVYFYCLTAGSYISMKKMMLLK